MDEGVRGGARGGVANVSDNVPNIFSSDHVDNADHASSPYNNNDRVSSPTMSMTAATSLTTLRIDEDMHKVVDFLEDYFGDHEQDVASLAPYQQGAYRDCVVTILMVVAAILVIKGSWGLLRRIGKKLAQTC